MEDPPSQAAPPLPPAQPRLRPVETHWVEYRGRRHLYLRDPVAADGPATLVSAGAVPLLALCDGTRDIPALQAALELRTGLRLLPTQIAGLIAQLDEALLLDSDRYRQAHRHALEAYRSSPSRPPSRAGGVYPAEPPALEQALANYCLEADDDDAEAPPGPVVGLVSPHIDYQRGHACYARLWQRASPSLREVELVILLGTDHVGSPGRLTLTRQDYATPWGSLPTDREAVEELADVLGPEIAFQEELHHAGEHSIELALVWLHYFLGRRSCRLLPILCGSFAEYVEGADPEADGPLTRAVAALRRRIEGARCLVVAAADLAHVGPAFGDSLPWGLSERARLRLQDQRLLEAICRGDEGSFLDQLRESGDRQRICGLPPIYLALRLLGSVRGEVTGYQQCPADDESGSLVSIAGVVLYPDG